jgi:hypothetical protein
MRAEARLTALIKALKEAEGGVRPSVQAQPERKLRGLPLAGVWVLMIAGAWAAIGLAISALI